MHTPLIERLSRVSRRHQNGELDPEVVARSFGAVLPVAEPLPETPNLLKHVGDDLEDLPIDAHAKRPAPKPSILTAANARLLSIKARTPERQQQVMTMIGMLLEPLTALDELVATLEEEHFRAIDDRWERIRQQGRSLADSLPALGAELAQAQHVHRESQEKRSHRKADLESFFEARKHLSTWASAKETEAADRKLLKAREAATQAADEEFEFRKSLAVVEGKMASAQENLRLLKVELKRLEAELNGQPFFDPTLGLSSDPLAYRNQW
jgi:hypothetical protein